MTSIIKLRTAIVVAALLWAAGSGWAQAQAADSATPPDPAIWGVYAQLVGTEWTGKPGSGRGMLRWSWGDGKHAGSIIEQGEAEDPKWIIRPGATEGTLTKDFSRGVHHFLGTVAADGSVLWIRKGWIKIPHRLALVGQELREEEGLELEGRQVVAVGQTYPYAQSGGVLATAPDANAGVSPATGVAAGRVDQAPADLLPAGASAQELEAAAATLLARAAAQRETETRARQQARLTQASAAHREAEAAAAAAEQVLARAVAARAESGSASAEVRTGPAVYAYCTAQGEPRTIFSSKVFTIDLEGTSLDKVPTMAVKLSSHGEEDLFGQFIAMVDSRGLDGDDAWCFVASSMALLSEHHAPKNNYWRRDDSSFDHWDPRGGFLIASETWRAAAGNGGRPAKARPAVPTAEEVKALEIAATRARAIAESASKVLQAEQASAASTEASGMQVAGTGHLTVEDIPPRPTVTPVDNDNSRDTTMLCVALHWGGFEGKGGVVFSSADAPVRVVDGRMVGDPSERFQAKVEARYGVNVMGSCTTNDDPAIRQRIRRDWFNAHPNFKQVETGMAP